MRTEAGFLLKMVYIRLMVNVLRRLNFFDALRPMEKIFLKRSTLLHAYWT